VALGAMSAFGPLATDLYLPALPAIARFYDSPVGRAQVTLAASFAGLAIGQLVYGPLSDRYGRRRPLLAGLAMFAAASVGCAAAPSLGVLICLLFLQAFGGCAGIVISRAVVRDLFTGADAAHFYTLIMLVFGLAPVLAPLIGGQFLALGGWRAPFIALAAFGVICLAVVLWLPETLAPDRRRTGGARDALRSYGLLLSNRAFLTWAGAGALSSVGLFAYIAASPAVVIDQYGVSPEVFGFVFGANAIGLVAASQIAGWLVRRLGPAVILRRAVVVQALAAGALVAVATTGAGGLAGVLTPLFFVVSCVGAVIPMSTALALTPFPERAGAAAALVGAVSLAVGAAAGALVGFVGLDPAASMAVVIASGCAAAAAILLLTQHRLEPTAGHDTPVRGTPASVEEPSARL
jgi:DHA1 family bicyclomycin/chloramphenicol resistance-like MFS transporter